MENKFIEYRKRIYASIPGTKGNLVKLSKSKLLSKKEKEKLEKVIESIEEFRLEYFSNRGKMKESIEITIPDRYSDKTFTVNLSDVFLVGSQVWTIRENNPDCVDLRDDNGKLLNWHCLEYVLKNPDIFKRVSKA